MARGQDRADQQQLGFPPGWARKQRCEGNEQGYNGSRVSIKWGQASLPCLYTFSKLCVKPSLERGLRVSAVAAASRTAAVGRRPYISARTGPEGLLASIPPPEVPCDWTAISVDGSHIDADRHLPLRCHLINLGGCALSYGQNSGCRMFSEPSLAVDDADLYLRRPDDPSDEVLISGPLLGALRTVREVERLADAVADMPQDRPALWPCWTVPWPGLCTFQAA